MLIYESLHDTNPVENVSRLGEEGSWRTKVIKTTGPMQTTNDFGGREVYVGPIFYDFFYFI